MYSDELKERKKKKKARKVKGEKKRREERVEDTDSDELQKERQYHRVLDLKYSITYFARDIIP